MNGKESLTEIISYKASYKKIVKKFAKEHDCEYLSIEKVFKER
jgi:hypothetical protein